MKKYAKLLAGFLRSRRGNVAILTGLLAPVLIGFCGLGADAGYWYFRQRDLQGAVDIAAYNGAMSLRDGNSLSVVDTVSTTSATNNGWTASQGSITVNSPPTSGSHQNDHSVEVLLTENEQRYFTALFSSGKVPINVRAVGTYDKSKNACMVGLNQHKSNTVEFWGNANADFQGCNIVSDSDSPAAFTVGGSAKVAVPCVDTVGGDSVSSGLSLTTCSSVTNNSPIVPDPYSGLAAPTVGTCYGGSIGSELDPGTYCGGLSLNGNITINSGLYVISGGTFKINANADVVGSGVTFYLTNGATLQFNGSATIQLSAPTSGPYSGILFFGDRSQTSATNTINGTATSLLTGAIYFPSQEIDYLGNFSGAGGCTQVVADTIYYTGSSTFQTNCTGAGMAYIPVPGSVKLVE